MSVVQEQLPDTATPPHKRKRLKKILLIVSITVVSLVLIGLIALPWVVMPIFRMNERVTFQEVLSPDDYGAVAISLTTSDNLKLQAWEVTAAQPKATLVFVSGIQNPSVTAYFPHAAWLREAGYSSVLLEMRAHGQSEGDKICFGMKEYRDVEAAVNYIKTHNPDQPVVGFGVSMGGATMLNAMGELPSLDGVIALSSFTNWPDVFCQNMSMMGLPEWFGTMEKPFIWLYLGFQHGFDSLKVNPQDEITKLGDRPSLLMHSKGDTQVPFVNFERLTKMAPLAETYVIEGDHHMILEEHFLNPQLDTAYASTMLDFLQRHFS